MKQLRFDVVALASIFAACGGAPGGERSALPLAGAVQQVVDDGVLEPMGTFEGSGDVPGAVTRMVLMADGTAHLEMLTYCQGGLLPCEPPVIDSFYRRTELLGMRHLEFFDQQETVLEGFDYRYDGKALEIIHQGDTDSQVLNPAPPWCSAASQCEQQWLPQLLCAGQWACVNSGCQFQCGGYGPGAEP